jgi:hypothetical protein
VVCVVHPEDVLLQLVRVGVRVALAHHGRKLLSEKIISAKVGLEVKRELQIRYDTLGMVSSEIH